MNVRKDYLIIKTIKISINISGSNIIYSKTQYHLKKQISRRINQYLNTKKFKLSCIKYLPYTIQELKQHLEAQFEPWMNWDNWGNYVPKLWDDNDSSTWTWNIDHIIPH